MALLLPRAALLLLLLLLHLCLLQRSAWARVELTVEPSVEVFLGESATLTCQHTFKDITRPPRLVMTQWFVEALGGSKRTRVFYGDHNIAMVDNGTDFTDRMDSVSSDHGTELFIRNARLSDNMLFFCQVNGLAAGNAEGKTRLRVVAAPQAPVIEGVQSTISATAEVPSKVASCEVSNGFPKPNITWYRNREPLTSTPGYVNVLTLVMRESSGLFSVQSTLEYRVTKEDKDARFSCEVSFFVPGAVRTMESSAINVSVQYPSTMVELWKESPQGLVKEGDAVELRCQGDGNPPPPFMFTREQDPSVNFPNNGDVLVLSSVTRRDSGIYQCRPLEADSQPDVKGEVQLTVHYLDPAVVVPKDSEFMLRGEDLTATCNALSSLKTSTVWYKDDQQVGEGNTLHLRDATYETSGEYICEVYVPSLPSLHTRGIVHIIVQGGPEMEGEEQEVQLEAAEGRLVNLSCEARGHPLPSITWSVTGSQSWQEVASKVSEHVIHSVVSVKVTSDISAQCNASNAMGTEAKVFSIRAIPRLPSVDPFSPVEGSGMIIVAIILGLLLLGILGGVLYFLRKKGMISCGRSGKQEITKEKTTKDDIVVEMKSDVKSEEAVHLKAVNGDKPQ